MKPPPFDYCLAESVEHAVALLGSGGGEAKLLAGGQSLMPMLNFRLLEPALLVDINRVPGLDRIEAVEGGIRIGALARHRAVAGSSEIARRFPVIAEAMRHVAHIGIRNRGTFGGSLAHADPAAELPMLALLLEAEIETDRRRVTAREFFRDVMATDLAEDEVLVAVRLPDLPAGAGWGFEEFARRHGDFAVAAVAAILAADGDGRCTGARIAIAGVGPTPLRAPQAEALLVGEAVTAESLAAAAQAAAEAADPMSDLHGSAEYRRHLAGVLAQRALAAAWERAGP